MKTVLLTGNDLTLEDVVAVCRHDMQVDISEQAKEGILSTRKIVTDMITQNQVIYGITTGFGKFSDTVISSDDCERLQKNLIITHAVGAGPCFTREYARGIMLLRINNLCKAYSGTRLEVVQTLVDMLNRGVTPQIPEQGSLGASGDLAPLSHMVLPMIGYGQAEYQGKVMPGAEAMNLAGIPIITLRAKEGLALINGTQAMTSVGAITTYDALNLLKTADVAAALSFEAQNGVTDALNPKVHTCRPHQGQIDTARILLHLLKGSKNTTRQGDIRVQDAYSLRCVPQIHGASKDAIKYIQEKVEIEINSVTDNPIILTDTKEGISAGNFHGQPMALSFDFLGIALSELANVSERRLERLVNPALSGLPAFLTENGGVNSGFMILQYSAAALVSENKILAHPASVDSIPSSANQEDHVSMGTIAARKARDIMRNVRRVLAMEILCACQAIDLRGNKGMGVGTQAAYTTVRAQVSKMDDDRPLYEDINTVERMLIDGKLIHNVEERAEWISF